MQFGITRGKNGSQFVYLSRVPTNNNNNIIDCRTITISDTITARPANSQAELGSKNHKYNNTKIIIIIFQRVWTIFGGQRVIDLLKCNSFNN